TWSESFIQHLRLRSSIIRKTMSEMEERPEMCESASYVPRQASMDLCHYLTALKRQGRTTEKFDPKSAAAMLMGAIFADAMGRQMMPDVYPQPEAKAAQMYTRLLLRALGVENGTRRTTNKQTKRTKQLSARKVSSRKSLRRALVAGRPIAIVFGFLRLLVPVTVRAQTPTLPTQTTLAQTSPLTLDEAVRTAESQSEAIRIARAGVQRAEGQQYQARSQRYPQLNGSASYTRTLASQFSSAGGAPAIDTTKPKAPPAPCDQYLLGPTATTTERLTGLEDASRCALGSNPFSSFGSLGFGAKNQYNLGLSLSQNLFAGGRIQAQNAIANSGRRAAEIELAAQRAQIRLDVTQAYYDATLADRLVALAESSAVQTENVLRQTQLARNVGNVSEFELLRAQVSSANQRPIVIQRQSDREVAYLRLKQLVNMPLDAPVQLTTAVDDPAAINLALEAAGAADTSAADRATVREAAASIDAQRGLLKITRAQRFPTLALTSQYGKVAFPTASFPQSGDFRTNWTVGLASQFPLFTGGRIKGEQMVAEANVREAQARYDQLREFAALDSRVTLNNLFQARAAWLASLGTADQARRAYSIAAVRYKEGISTQIELNDARILLEQAVANRALAARNLQVARVRLSLLPDLPLQTTGAAPSQTQAVTQQQQSQPSSQPTQAAQTQAQGQQASGIPPQ
ncbi:MAG: TolC family protein, partial [Gemmatimonadota bacterium]|nr:TolC family protein [Gemmatimonadota bacterium]